MAELAAGAVSSLLGVIRNEMALLGGVRGDVQFIKEEMESMSSFLLHLARTAPPGGEHDEQVRTWMNQVRVLAQDCNNCLDLYLYRGNPEIHRARGGLRRYLWWAPWFLQKLVAQHRAAIQLRLLKDRAQHVGERRLRYGVQVPGKSLPGEQSPPGVEGLAVAVPSSSAQATIAGSGDASGDDEEDGSGDQLVAVAMATTTEYYFGPRAFFQPRTLDEYVKAKLLDWIYGIPWEAVVTLSIAIVAPDADKEALALAYETLVHPPAYHCGVLVDISMVHHDFLPLRPKEVLYYILRELLLQQADESRSQAQAQQQAAGLLQPYQQKWKIYSEKRAALGEVKKKIQEMKVYEKLEKIGKDIRLKPLKDDQLQKLLYPDFEQINKGVDVDQLGLHVVFQLLLAASSQQDQVMKTKDMHKLAALYEATITKLAEKLKEHMEAIESTELKEHMEKANSNGMVTGGKEEHDQGKQRKAPIICLPSSHYERILRDVFPKPRSSSTLQQEGSAAAAAAAAKQSCNTTTTSTLDEDQVRQMIHEVRQMIHEAKEEILQKVIGDQPPGGRRGPKSEIALEDMEPKIKKIKRETKEQLKMKGLVDEIKHHLNGNTPLFILKLDETMSVTTWEDTRNALSLLECSADASRDQPPGGRRGPKSEIALEDMELKIKKIKI
ncbi:hypothetical protein U9M48_036670 [Paspalum notatum var. saurae]|uniref:Disease resistance N-terminal domain-containing protein n=1 Tax=Paspalum notatum var. saurae TaxID=547442 RepID=A0AAQ3UDJ7_PASNO